MQKKVEKVLKTQERGKPGIGKGLKTQAMGEGALHKG